MKRFFLPVLLGLLFITLQASWLTLPYLRWVRPDIVFLLTLYVGLTFPLLSGGILALFLGYLMDLYSGNGLGLFTLSRLLLFLGTQFFKRHLYLEGFPARFLFVFLVSLSEGPLLFLLLKALVPEAPSDFFRQFFYPFLPHCLVSALLSPFLFFLLGRREFFAHPVSLPKAGAGGKG